MINPTNSIERSCAFAFPTPFARLIITRSITIATFRSGLLTKFLLFYISEDPSWSFSRIGSIGVLILISEGSGGTSRLQPKEVTEELYTPFTSVLSSIGRDKMILTRRLRWEFSELGDLFSDREWRFFAGFDL